MNARREAGRRLVIPRCNRPELLDFAEDILDPVPFPVGVSVKGARKRAVFLWRNHGVCSAVREPIKQGVRVTGLVADPCREGNVLKKVGSATRSWLGPGRTIKRINVPIASVSATILLVKPPFECPMPLYEPLFPTRRPWHGLAGSCRPPIRPTDRIRRITRGHYDQKAPSAPTRCRNGRKRRKTRFPLPQYAGRSRSHRLMTAIPCGNATAPLQETTDYPPSGRGLMPFPTEAVPSAPPSHPSRWFDPYS